MLQKQLFSFLHCSTSIHVQISGILFNDHKTWLHNAFHYSCVDISFIRSKIAKGAKHYMHIYLCGACMLLCCMHMHFECTYVGLSIKSDNKLIIVHNVSIRQLCIHFEHSDTSTGQIITCF